MRIPTIMVQTDVLSSWLTLSACTKSQLAYELGISKGRVSQLLSSHHEPSAHLIAKLLVLTHLPFDRLFKVIRDLPPISPGSNHGKLPHDARLQAGEAGAPSKGLHE